MKNSITALCAALALAAPLASVAPDKSPPTPAPAAAPAPVALSSAELRGRIQSDKKGSSRGTPAHREGSQGSGRYTSTRGAGRPQSVINRSIIDYVNAGTNITDANAKRIADQILKAQVNEAKIRQTQFAKVSKVLPATKAARFMQLENKMRSVILYETASAIPLVP